MRDYRKYEVWSKGHDLTLYIYRELVPGFPKTGQYGICPQLKRACYSIGLNIVEGWGRNTDKDFAHLDMSLGSLHENEYCILLSFDLGFITKDKFEIAGIKLNELKAKLITLIKKIRES